MRVGLPREVKTGEGRVALTPAACQALIGAGAEVLVESGAGAASGFADAAYAGAGACLVDDPAALWGEAELIVKVKEPQPRELEWLRPGHRLFCFLHLAAEPDLARALAASGATAIAFETVSDARGRLPLLAPMSQIAGRIAGQIAPTLLYGHAGGRGVLLGGIPGSGRGRAVVIGIGNAGKAALGGLLGHGTPVTAFDLDPERLEEAAGLSPAVTACYSYPDAVAEAVAGADLVVGAVLIAGARAPRVVEEETVAAMPEGAAIIDLAIDQGGCVATARPTTYAEPTYRRHGVTHFAVTNMPGAVPRTASEALSARVAPYARRLLDGDWASDPGLAAGVNVRDGEVVQPAVKAALDEGIPKGKSGPT